MANKNKNYKRSIEDAGMKIGAPYYDTDGTLTRNVILPEIEILGDKSKYLIKKSEESKNKIFRPIMNLFFSSNKEQKYSDAKTPYGQGYGHERDNIINVKNGKIGERNRLEMMGFKNINGKYKYPKKNKISNGTNIDKQNITEEEYLQWCAENANVINSYYGKPTAGDAWTRHGIYGDSAIVVAPYKKSDYWFGNSDWKARSMSKDQARYVAKHIDDPNVELKSGDIVDMRYPGSSFSKTAFEEGDYNRANSHTGTIIKTGPNKENTYVAHYYNGTLNMTPIGDALGVSWINPYVTGIRRPGTKEHPYK